MKTLLISGIQSALNDLGVSAHRDILIEKPADERFGDASTNIAMVLARAEKKSTPNCYRHCEPIAF